MTEQVQLSFSSDTDAEVVWAVTGARLTEQFNRPYVLELGISSNDVTAEAINQLGASVSVVFERGEFQRELCGIVTKVVDGKRGEEELVPATLTIVPALEALRHRRNSRIFPDQSIKDTILEVLEAALDPYGRSVDVDFLGAEYPVPEHTVQYQETDLDFVHRLMELYGVGYRFTVADGKEVLVLFDSDAANFALTSLNNQDGVLPLTLLEGGAEGQEDCREFTRRLQLRSTVARTTLFDWADPSGVTDFEDDEPNEFDAPDGAAIGPEREDYEHVEPSTAFGYHSDGLDVGAAEDQVLLRRLVHRRDAQTFAGVSTASQMQPGAFFELLNHPEASLTNEYFVTKVVHEVGDFVEDFNENFKNHFECLPTGVEWRPDRKTKRPRISGVQTATVVGPAGEEIFTDESGRIKVQFHWDRRKQYDDAASCFIRVVQPWAGNGWGFVFLPRIGMEVAVTFIDGDPDRPVITGCLYNGDNATPYPLPDEQTKSTIKTESSPGGDGFNELRFEDAAGSEEIYVHAQKDYNETVLNDHTTGVGNDQTITVGNDQTITVDNDQTQTITGNQTEDITKDQKLTVTGNRNVTVVGKFTELIEGGEQRDVAAGVTENIIGGETRTVADSVTETITGGETRDVTGAFCETINGDVTYTHHGGVTDTIDGMYTLTVTSGYQIMAPAGMEVIAPGGITIVDPVGTTETAVKKSIFSAHKEEIVGFKFSMVGAKIDIVPALALGIVGIKVDMVGLKVDLCKVKFANKPMSIEDALVALISKVVDLNFDDIDIQF